MTAQEHKVSVYTGKPMFYDPPELKRARAKLTAHLAKHVPETKYTGPVQLIVKWCFPITRGHEHGEWKISRPDTDNLQKLLKDCMTKVGYWNDDAQVASEITEKFWAQTPGIYISIMEL